MPTTGYVATRHTSVWQVSSHGFHAHRTTHRARATRGRMLLSSAHAALAFDFDDVAALARRKARAAYEPPDRVQPAELEALGYDRYRDIRFRPDRAIWRADGAPFDLMFFHRGQGNPRVRMNEVVADKARHLPYDSDDFDFGKNTLQPATWRDLDYAGFRVHYHLNGPEYKDELIVFLGASYFRCARGRNALRLVGARLGHRHGRRPGRGVPLLHRILDREARFRRAHAAHVRAARLAARERRVSVRRDRRATRRSWTCASGSTCARASPRWASRRSRACISSARTSRIESTSGPRCTTPTA